MKRLFLYILFVSLLGPSLLHAFRPLLPYPQQVEWEQALYTFPSLLLQIEGIEESLCREWAWDAGIPVHPTGKKGHPLSVKVAPFLPEVPIHSGEAYRLQVKQDRIEIEAETETGVFYAFQTLRQLARPGEAGIQIAGCRITDWPAFRIRGFMQDTGRSYISLEELKKEIQQLARYKINTFHWHLSENQAWRLESKLFPQLNEPQNMTRMAGQFYTQEEARELVRFCNAHQVTLIPELDMPGHSESFVRTFGYDMQSPQGMAILKQLVEEACDLFEEVPWFHIGTDEVTFSNPTFVPEMVACARGKGKKVIAWNPGWPFEAGEIDMLHLWSYRGKPHPGIPVIDSRLHYINHYDTFADIVALYKSNIAGQQQGSHEYAGAILALWYDRRIEPEWNMILENGLYPAMLTLAERSWRGGQPVYMDRAGCLLDPVGSEGYRSFCEFEERLLWHKEHCFNGFPFGYVRQTQVHWRITDAFPNRGDLSAVFLPEHEERTTYKYEGNTYQTHEVSGAGIYLRHVWGKMVPAFYEDPQEEHTAYAWTWIHSPVEQTAGALIEFQNYGRSEADLPPRSGTWDYRGSRIWLNEEEIRPPVWTATHTIRSNEIPLGNENAVAREPIPLVLKKGWNKVFLKLPAGKFQTPEVRLQKWMFTFVLVTPDGSKALENVIYSPDKQWKE